MDSSGLSHIIKKTSHDECLNDFEAWSRMRMIHAFSPIIGLFQLFTCTVQGCLSVRNIAIERCLWNVCVWGTLTSPGRWAIRSSTRLRIFCLYGWWIGKPITAFVSCFKLYSCPVAWCLVKIMQAIHWSLKNVPSKITGDVLPINDPNLMVTHQLLRQMYSFLDLPFMYLSTHLDPESCKRW